MTEPSFDPTVSSRRSRLPLPKPGEMFAGYRIEREIARGGAGAVYVALGSNGERYALKLFLGDMNNPVRLERFRREVNIGTSLLHAGIVRVLDHGEDAGRVFMVMELIEDALPIDRYVEERRVPLRKRVQLLMEAAQTVHTAHTAGIVHRDLKPDNVLVTPSGQVKVVDFGIAKQLDRERLTQSGVIIGTLHYMAPEQVAGQSGAVSARTDVYALGVLAFQLMSGELPIEAETGIEIMAMVLDGKALRLEDVAPHAPRGIADVVRMAMSVDPAERYADGGAMAKDLAAVCTDTETEASGRVQAPARSSRGPLVFAVAVVLGIAAAALVWSQRSTTLDLGQLRSSAKLLRGEARSLLSAPDRFLSEDAAAIAALSLRADQLEGQAATDSDREAVVEALAPVRALQAMLALSNGDREGALALAPTVGSAQPEVDALWVGLAVCDGSSPTDDGVKNVSAITRALRRGLESPDLYGWLAAALGQLGPPGERRADQIVEALTRVKAARDGRLTAKESWLWAAAKSGKGEHEVANEVLVEAGGAPPTELVWAIAIGRAERQFFNSTPQVAFELLDGLPEGVATEKRLALSAQVLDTLAETLATLPGGVVPPEYDQRLASLTRLAAALRPDEPTSESLLRGLVNAATELKSTIGLPWLSAAVSDAYPDNRRVQFDLAEVSWRPQLSKAHERLGLPNLRRACALAETQADRSKFNTSLFNRIWRSNDATSISKEEYDEAVSVAAVALAAAETTNDKVEVLVTLGEFLYHARKYEACLSAIREALELDPSELRAHGRRIRALEALKRFDDDFVRYVEEQSRLAFSTEHDDNALIWSWLIHTLGHSAKALVGMERHMQRTERWRTGWWARLALLQLIAGRSDDAVRSLRVAESKWGEGPRGGVRLDALRALIADAEKGKVGTLRLQELVLAIGL